MSGIIPLFIHNSSHFLLILRQTSLSTRKVLKPCLVTLWSGKCSHVSVKHIKLHSLYSLWVLISSPSLSILLSKNLKINMMIAGTDGLSFLFLAFHLAPALKVCRLRSSTKTVSLNPGTRSYGGEDSVAKSITQRKTTGRLAKHKSSHFTSWWKHEKMKSNFIRWSLN